MKSALIKLHLAVFLWGFTGVLGKLIHLNEGLLVWYRLLITIITLLILSKIKYGFEPLATPVKFRLMGVGTVVALHWVFFYGSIKYANVSIALVCLSSIAFFTALFEPLFAKSRFSWMDVVLSIIGVAGIALIFHFDDKFRTGIYWGIISSVFSALFASLNKTLVNKASSQSMMLYELLGGFIFLSLLLPFYLKVFTAVDIFPTFNDWIWLLLLSWVCTVVAMDLSFQALKKVSAFTQNLTLNLEPIYGIALAFVIYHEQKDLSDNFYWGLALILLSVALQTLRVYQRKTN